MNVMALVFAALGLLDSAYLLTVHWGWWTAVCLGVGNCEVVNMSVYSELLGIPVALLGGLSYIALMALSYAVLQDIYAEYAQIARFFIAAVGVAFSAYLTGIELFVLHEICPWCVMSAILITLIAVLSFMDLRQASLEPQEA